MEPEVQIRVLDENTINKIAAGEVVERPLSVVKELVENAIDAKAGAITVDLENGGIEFIRVTDNGSGIPASQCRTAFLRHATSKIRDEKDLISIASLGFRGEALSSIAAVSKVELISKTKDSLTGFRLSIEGGRETAYEEIGAPNGTTFLVRNLFYNTPARRKFLKSEATEGSYIEDLMERFALSHPEISFTFSVKNKPKFQTSGNGKLKEVIYRIYGKEVYDTLLDLDFEGSFYRVRGFIAKPECNRSNRNFETIFVNGRYVKSEHLFKTTEYGYDGLLMMHKFPFCVYHIETDPTNVDVNVHPNKLDVRFRDRDVLFEEISAAIRNTILQSDRIVSSSLFSRKEEREERKEEENNRKELLTRPIAQPFETTRVRQFAETNTADIVFDTTKSINENDNTGIDVVKEENKSAEYRPDESIITSVVKEVPEPKEAYLADTPLVVRHSEQLELFDKEELKNDFIGQYRMIGQIFDTYWIIERDKEVLYIDQHAAHEKVKFERMMKHYREKEVFSEDLLVPVVLTLTSKEKSILEEYRDTFEAMGYGIEEFGQNDYCIRKVPYDLYGFDAKAMFLEVLDELYENPVKDTTESMYYKIATMACKAAVKGNMRISESEARVLIDELLTLENPYNCPHGRPCIISISRTEMERRFKRIIH